MKKSEFKKEFIEIINSDVAEMSLNQKIHYAKELLFQMEKDEKRNEQNKGKEWTDEELRLILSFSPSKQNCLLFAKAFSRGYGSIEQIYRWAATNEKSLTDKGRANDKFIMQIKRVAKETGWRV